MFSLAGLLMKYRLDGLDMLTLNAWPAVVIKLFFVLRRCAHLSLDRPVLCIYTVHVATIPVVNPFTYPLFLSGLFSAGDTKRAFPERYRDTWPESELVGIAAEEAKALGAPVEVAA